MKAKVNSAKLLLILICCSLAVSLIICSGCSLNSRQAYLGGTSPTITLYTESGSVYEAVDELPRGTEITAPRLRFFDGDKSHFPITYSGKQYYVDKKNVVSSKNNIVQETDMYVRTPVTILTDDTSPSIAGYAPKGAHLVILDYTELRDDGIVDMYEIRYGDVTGFVFGQYLVDNEEDALADYDGDGLLDARSSEDNSASFELYGGYSSSLDYYPVTKTQIGSTELLTDARAIYLSDASLDNIDEYVEFIESTDINCVVLDCKDATLSYESEVAKEYSPSSYDAATTSIKEFSKVVDKLRDTGVYLVGRIVCFNDYYYGKDHPGSCIRSPLMTDDIWPSAYSRDVWEYDVRLALEAIDLFAFDEIQFDYVRFPENSYDLSCNENTDFRNDYDEEKGQAIQNFCFYAADQIHRAGAYFSVDVFGECANGYVTAYGQYWAAISNVVDAISGMPYTDHYGSEVDTWSDPYTTVNEWATLAAEQQKLAPTGAVVRTWITGYDVPNWSPTVEYNTTEMIAQAQALQDAGLTGGFIPWNAASSLTKYRAYQGLWDKDAVKKSTSTSTTSKKATSTESSNSDSSSSKSSSGSSIDDISDSMN